MSLPTKNSMRTVPRRILFGRDGEARYYVVSGGVFYGTKNQALAYQDGDQVLSLAGDPLGWFDGVALRDGDGALLAYTAQALGRVGMELAEPLPLKFRPQPTSIRLRPRAAPRARPGPLARWSERTLEDSIPGTVG